jgi:pyridoxal phosphate enzyme (YggS family)
VVELIRGLRAADVAAALARVHDRIEAAGRRAEEVEVLAAVKYLPADELGALADGGVRVLGENRAQELVAKATAWPDRFTWDFIGALQSRRIRLLAGRVRYIHSVASQSALDQLARVADTGVRVMIEVNIAGEAGKAGIDAAELPRYLDACPVEVVGLMTMPPLARDPEGSRPYFAELRSLAERHGLPELSMGTSQDYGVAVQEGATIIRLGSVLYGAGAP